MATASGLSYSSVQRIWKAHELKPHRIKTVKLSNHKRLVEKVPDIVGLYLNPPDKALVFSVDEKSRIRRSTVLSPDCRSSKAVAAP